MFECEGLGVTKTLSEVLSLFIFSVFGQDPQITKDILPEVKRAGETAYLNCTVAAQGNNKVSE